MPEAPEDLDAVTRQVGAADLFVLRRIESDRFVNLGGVGRGAGWAGNLELRLAEEPAAAEAARTGGVEVVRGGLPVRWMFGPYHARSAAFVPVSDDLMVVFGELGAADPEALRAAAEAAVAIIAEVSPAKRLADELEILHALRELGARSHATLDDAVDHVLGVATTALSCEIGVLALTGERRAWSRGTGAVPLVEADLVEALGVLRARELPTCVQDAAGEPLPVPLDELGAVAYYVLEVPGELPALLVLAHTDAGPRGFTSLCQLLGLRLADAANGVLAAAAHRERLEAEIAHVRVLARRDALTGLGNRLAWDEALGADRAPGPASVVIVDVDGLKRANDQRGHDAGDNLIRATAVLLQSAVRDGDVVARVGGDEFAVLLEGTGGPALVDRIAALVGEHPLVDGHVLSVAAGVATSTRAGDLAALQAEADRDMYRAKLALRTPSDPT